MSRVEAKPLYVLSHVSEGFYVLQSLHTREREDRVEFRGAARGQITGEKRDDDPRKRLRLTRSHRLILTGVSTCGREQSPGRVWRADLSSLSE